MWTPTTREQHSRKALRYQTDFRLDALAVDNRAARAGLASDPLATGHDQRVIDLLKEAVVPRLVAPAATMRARRPRGASATRWSTPTGGASCSRRIRRVSRTAMVAGAAVRLTRLVSVHREGLCRQRLRRREGRHGHRDRRRDRAQKPRSGRLRRPTAPLGRGALLRLDQPQPATGKGLRGHHRLGRAFLYAASVMLLVRRLARAP